MANETSNGTSTNAPESPMAMVIISMVYLVIFVTSELGNGFVIFSLLVRQRRGRTAMDDFVLNLATTDFLFTTSSLVYAVEYLLNEWKLGVAACKIEGQLVEVTYIVSTLTLTTISYTRYKAANTVNPFKLLGQKSTARRDIALIWLFSFVFTLPLLYGYTVVRRGGSLHCTNLNFNEVTRRTYYLILAILLFVIPITVMIVSQYKITSGLRSHSQSQTTGVMSAAISARVTMYERRITKLLKWMWIIFMCCCAPFTTYRTLDYFVHIRKRGELSNQLWQLCQMLIILNAAINPLLYHGITKNGLGDRTKAKWVEWCCCCIRHGGRDHVELASNQERGGVHILKPQPSNAVN